MYLLNSSTGEILYYINSWDVAYNDPINFFLVLFKSESVSESETGNNVFALAAVR